MEHLGDWRRTATCGELRLADAGREAILMGWVNRVRDHGGVFFLDVRDRSGMTQTVCRPSAAGGAVVEKARELRPEYVIAVRGKVSPRPEEMRNPQMPTGEVEIEAEEIRVLNTSDVPPFVIGDLTNASEDLRLEYRYLDLRAPSLQAILGLRHRVALETRRYLDEQGFWEIETPLLVRPTPEGARDYLVPSRIHPGTFYALPQSPQLYKQILMVSGMDRYFQIARCLRDEDLRADRQPEHTQIDIEMSFAGEEQVFALVEGLMLRLFERCLGQRLEAPFPRISYEEAMDHYGSDKPDLRFAMPIADLSEAVRGSDFRVFRDALEAGGTVKAIVVPQGGSLSRREQDELEAHVKLYGARGLARARVTADGGLGGGLSLIHISEPTRQR
ncbi:MAG: aspartate--tRNA ligase, partial [Candidatus Eisenbacteria bacterium]|nr:aspartate--tRNA ligase [Candidatus Eisenbacteria bacterium]